MKRFIGVSFCVAICLAMPFLPLSVFSPTQYSPMPSGVILAGSEPKGSNPPQLKTGKKVGVDNTLTLKLTGKGIKVVQVDQVIVVKKDVTVVDSFPFNVEDSSPLENADYLWTVPPGVYAVPRGSQLEVRNAPKGELTVDLTRKLLEFKDGKIITKYEYGVLTFSIQTIPPGPTPPTPPDPPVPPNPTKPLINFDKPAVMVLYEKAEPYDLKSGIYNLVYSKPFYDYLAAHTGKEEIGTPAFRKYDPDNPPANNDYPYWREAHTKYSTYGKKSPYIVISNPAGQSYEGPITTTMTIDEVWAILKKHLGN